MALAEGTVSVLDTGGVVFTRIWCGYELYVSLASPPAPKPAAEDGPDCEDGVLWKKGDLLAYKWVVCASTRGSNAGPSHRLAAPCRFA